MANLIASAQVLGGDLIEIDYDEDLQGMVFLKQSSETPIEKLIEIAEATGRQNAASAAAGGVMRQSRRAKA
jgi:hypothetical protein